MDHALNYTTYILNFQMISVPDPVFVFAEVLEWADIARNGRDELVLTDSYREI